MRPVSPALHRISVPLESLQCDPQQFARVIADLRANAGEHLPITSWLEAGGGTTGTMPPFSTAQLARDWLGYAAATVNAEALYWYGDYLRGIDVTGVFTHYFPSPSEWRNAAEQLLIADLGTMVDLNLVSASLPPLHAGRQLRIVEVGGGYGRLAEAFMNVYAGQVKYVLVDAVPASLLYADEYLRRALPGGRVGSFYREDPFDLERFDCYIVPAWHVAALDSERFDLAVNVQSMQEMDQHHVDYYLSWFDRILADEEGIAYFCNRRDHLFRGQWRYPDHWECLLKRCTPRSWLRDMPAEVFRKGRRSFAAENRLRDSTYARELDLHSAGALRAAAERGYRVY